MDSIWMLYLILLAVGGLICFRGLSLYKLVQFLICGWIGYYLTLSVCEGFMSENSVVVALIAGLIAGFLGFHFYKVGMYISAACSAFVVVFSFFWRQAMEMGKTLVGQVNGAKEIFSSGNLAQIMVFGTKIEKGTNVFEHMMKDAGVTPSLWQAEAEMMMELIKRGLFWAGIAGVVCGVLALIFGDYVIMVITAVFGGMLLNLLVEQFVALDQLAAMIVLAVFSAIGIVMQNRHKRRKG